MSQIGDIIFGFVLGLAGRLPARPGEVYDAN